MNGSFDSIDKSQSQFDTSSYDLYDTQTQRTAMSSEFDEPLGVVNYSRHPMGRPRAIPTSANGLPPPPPQVPRAHDLRSVRADVQPKPSFDLTFQNQNFRETPSTGSMAGPQDYWDTGANLQSNGQAVKYKNTNVPNEFPRSVSMATASTFPLQPSTDTLSESSANLTPLSQQRHYAPRVEDQAPPFSKSYEQLQYDPAPYRHTRPSLQDYGNTPTLPYRGRDEGSDVNGGLFHSSQSQPILQQEGSPQMMSFTPQRTESPNYRRNGQPGRVKETSLDDLDTTTELDYELDETIRPASTYMETSVDDGGGLNLQPLRSAQSQYIPSSVSRAPQQNDPYRDREGDFKALSNRSKSMPLETEM